MMRDEHIIDMIEGSPLGSLSEGEMTRVRAHASACAPCARAYEAARVSALLLAERAAVEVVPSPFFQTRVLAALRERRAADDIPAWRRMWRAAGALVYSMAGVVIVLGGLSVFAPESAEVAAATDPYTAEAVLLERTELAAEDADFSQTLSTVYGAEGAAEGDDGQDR
jgi:hypothetical protein